MSLVQRLTDELGRAILGGDFPPGAVLPREGDLSIRGGVGRGAVREAVKMLQAKGLIESRPKRGTTVLPIRNWHLYDRDVQIWMRTSVPTRALLSELLEVRTAFEPLAASLSARRGAPEALRAIDCAHDRMHAALIGRDDPYDADLAFHTAILEASGNRFLAALAPLIGTALLFSFRITNAARGDRVGDLDAHTRIADAIRSRDSGAAEQSMRALLDDVEQTIAEFDVPRHSAI